jgi:hypothetical protein
MGEISFEFPVLAVQSSSEENSVTGKGQLKRQGILIERRYLAQERRCFDRNKTLANPSPL